MSESSSFLPHSYGDWSHCPLSIQQNYESRLLPHSPIAEPGFLEIEFPKVVLNVPATTPP